MLSEKYYIVRKVKGKEQFYTLNQWGRTDWTNRVNAAVMFKTKDLAISKMKAIYFFTGYDMEVRKTDKLNKAYQRAMQGV